MTGNPARGVVLVVAGALLFVVNAGVSRVIQSAGVESTTLTTIRCTGTAVVLLVVVAARRELQTLVPRSLREAVNVSSAPAPAGIDEFELAGLTKAQARIVGAPYVAESPVHLECVLTEIVELPTPEPSDPNTVIFGEVVGVDIADRAIVDGRIDAFALDPIARLGYDQYVRVTDVFRMRRPDWPLD